MKRVPLRVFVGILSAISAAFCCATPAIKLVQRDYPGTTVATDVWTAPDPFDDIEFTASWSHPVVRRLGDANPVYLTFQNYMPTTTFVGTLRITSYALLDENGDPVEQHSLAIEENISIAPGGSTTTYVNLGLIAPFVAKGQIAVIAWLDGNSGPSGGHSWGSSLYYQAWERAFVTYDAPAQSMIVPWVEVLEDACSWATGLNNDLDIVTELPFQCFVQSRMVYNLFGEGPGEPVYQEYDSPSVPTYFN